MRHRARTSFVTTVAGTSDRFRVGDPVPPDIARLLPEFVEEAGDGRGVEEATAVPGEPRPGYPCDVCGRVAKTAAGLGAQRKVHE